MVNRPLVHFITSSVMPSEPYWMFVGRVAGDFDGAVRTAPPGRSSDHQVGVHDDWRLDGIVGGIGQFDAAPGVGVDRVRGDDVVPRGRVAQRYPLSLVAGDDVGRADDVLRLNLNLATPRTACR